MGLPAAGRLVSPVTDLSNATFANWQSVGATDSYLRVHSDDIGAGTPTVTLTDNDFVQAAGEPEYSVTDRPASRLTAVTLPTAPLSSKVSVAPTVRLSPSCRKSTVFWVLVSALAGQFGGCTTRALHVHERNAAASLIQRVGKSMVLVAVFGFIVAY